MKHYKIEINSRQGILRKETLNGIDIDSLKEKDRKIVKITLPKNNSINPDISISDLKISAYPSTFHGYEFLGDGMLWPSTLSFEYAPFQPEVDYGLLGTCNVVSFQDVNHPVVISVEECKNLCDNQPLCSHFQFSRMSDLIGVNIKQSMYPTW